MVFLPFLPKKIPFFLLLILLSLIFSSTTSYSQVKIKEKVSIKPNTLKKNAVDANPDWYFDFGYLDNVRPISIITYFDPDSVISNLYRITFVSGGDLQFSYGYWEQELLGDTLIVSGYSIRWGWYWGIKLLNPYLGIAPQLVTIKVESIDWFDYKIVKETKYFDLTILPNNYILSAENYIYAAVVGEKVESEISIESGSNTPALTIPPNTIKLNLEIIRGAYLGDIEISEKNLIGKVINNVDHEGGKLKFSFVANGILALDEDTVIVRVSSSYPNIDDPKMKDFVFVIMKYEPLEVTINPATPAQGEPANIIVKKRNQDGTLTDFCADQWFDIKITAGADYATFFIPDWNDTTSQTGFVNQGFQLLITKPIPNGAVQPTILVKTMGEVATSIIPTDTGQNGKYNNQKKSLALRKNLQQTNKTNSAISTEPLIQKNKLIINKSKSINNNGDCILWDSIILWGTASTQAEAQDTLYIKADFGKTTLSAGDTINIRVTKVDKNGNESSFPAGTLFEAKVLEGCLGGELLSSDNRTGKYLSNLTQPFYFIVDNNIDSTITNIEIKVGIPVSGYLSYDDSFNNVNGKIINAATNRVKQNKVLKKQMDGDGCSTNQFIGPSYDYAVGSIGGGCDSAPECDNEIPKAPIFRFKYIPSGVTDCLPKTMPNGKIVKEIGGFSFNNEKIINRTQPIAPYELDVCYDTKNNVWNIKTDKGNTIELQYNLFWCNENVYDKWSNPIETLEDLNTIPDQEICKALEDLVNQRNLFSLPNSKYILTEVIQKHEEQHQNDFIDISNKEYLDMTFSEKYLQFKKSCQDVKSLAVLKRDAKKNIDTLLDEFLEKEKIAQDNKMGKITVKDGEEELDDIGVKYERNTQISVFGSYGKKYMIELYNLGKAKGQGKCVEVVYKKYPGLFNRGNQ